MYKARTKNSPWWRGWAGAVYTGFLLNGLHVGGLLGKKIPESITPYGEPRRRWPGQTTPCYFGSYWKHGVTSTAIQSWIHEMSGTCLPFLQAFFLV